ncbi:MAG: helicase, partial [Oscillochloris sp.]|nr:helicase [Oscillochloris sp.]
IDRTGFLDASVLGEAVHPRNFNTLRRIRDEDGVVVEEQEQFIELASTEFLQQQLRTLLEGGARAMLEGLPDGIHSGLHRQGSRGIFFYYTAPDPHGQGRQHFWRYYDAVHDRILDNRFVIAGLIACSQDTPRVIGELDVFAIQERVIAHILESVQVQAALEAAPTVVDPVQQTLMTALTAQLQNPTLQRADVRTAIADVRKPATTSQVRRLKELYLGFSAAQDIVSLLAGIRALYGDVVPSQPASAPSSPTTPLRREDLRLVCFDHIVA